MKYLLCFRGTNHKHDALREGIEPHGGESGPIEYHGVIETDAAIPMTPRLDVAAYFPQKEKDDKTTIDVILMPLPQKPDAILKSKIEVASSNDEKKLYRSIAKPNTSDTSFVNTSSSQKLDSITAVKILGKTGKSKMAEAAYEDLGGMVWSHEVAAKSIPKQNVVASLQCTRKGNSFEITGIEWQDAKIVNSDFIKEGFKKQLEIYLKNYLHQHHPLPSDTYESSAYRGYITSKDKKTEDFTKIHKDPNYQSCLEEVQKICDNGKILFTHEDNVKLMQQYKDKDFNVEKFCSELKNEKDRSPSTLELKR